MDVFSIGNDSRSVKIWGPTASVSVTVEALSDVVGKDKDWVLEGLQVGAKEIVDIRQCFNDVSYIYALGNDQSNCALSLSFVIFLGSKDCSGENNTNTLMLGLSQYRKTRISQKTSPTTIQIGNFSTKGWLRGLDIGQVDASRGLCHGVASFIMQFEAK